MNIFRLIFIYTILFPSWVFALSDTNLQLLQDSFYIKVLKTNTYKKRFNTYLKQNCPDSDDMCYQSVINRLELWKTTKNDSSLNNMLSSLNKLRFIDDFYWKDIHTKLLNKFDKSLTKTQFISIIDLSKQLYILSMYDYDKQQFEFIGSDLISSGNIDREQEIKFGESHYLKTPTGIFKIESGWRSDGKLNEDNTTLGYGEKNRYIYDFGKQKSIRYNTFDKNGNKIYNKDKWKLISDTLNFAMHSHKSAKPMGEPYSHGCIRMTDELNRFLDNNLVLHKNILDDKKWIHKYSKEPQNPQYYEQAGEYLIVFDKI